ncbi:transcriptional regulator [Streptomyces sp. NPDC044780]|uniref:transcriptional regulator n=1 Tax=unclassified Streptomyces TaxID=2593676 RepID=UPI00340DC760
MTDPTTAELAAVFAAVFVALFIGHSVGDHWTQTQCQSDDKGLPGWTGRLACLRHVLTLTLTKAAVLAPVVALLHLPVTTAGLTVGLGVDAATHYWADRRTTLAKLAKLLRKTPFYTLGTAAHEHAPVTAKGKPAAHLGTGAYALDQSWHILWLGAAALAIATL